MTCSRTVSPGTRSSACGQERVVLGDEVDLARGAGVPATIGGVAGAGAGLAGGERPSRQRRRAARRGRSGRGTAGGTGHARESTARADRHARTAPALTRYERRAGIVRATRHPLDPPSRPPRIRGTAWRIPTDHAAPTHDRSRRAAVAAVRLEGVASVRRRRRRTARRRSAYGDVVAVAGDRPRRPRRRVLLDARAVRVGQDDDAADDRRLRAADRRPDPAPRRGRHDRPAVRSRRQHGLPGLRPVPAHDRRRQRRRTG